MAVIIKAKGSKLCIVVVLNVNEGIANSELSTDLRSSTGIGSLTKEEISISVGA
jgi:hypothetical protein